MNDRMLYTVTRTGLLLAVTLLLQGIRLLLPIPPQVSMFLIGSLVNACLILAVLKVGWKSGLVVACITPVFAWLEGMLPFLPFIIPVAVGNSVLVGAVYRLRAYKLPGVYGAAVCKLAGVSGSSAAYDTHEHELAAAGYGRTGRDDCLSYCRANPFITMNFDYVA